MAVIDDLRVIITDLDTSVDSILLIVENLRTELGNAVLASELQPEIDKLQIIKAKIDAARNVVP